MQSLAPALLVAFEKVPPGHGSAAAAPGGQYDTSSHALHAVSPSPSWYSPPAHAVHLSLTAIVASIYVLSHSRFVRWSRW